MANMLKNLDLFSDEPEGYDGWRKAYWDKKHKNKDEVGEMAERVNSASVETVKKPRDKEQESKDFHKAQLDIRDTVLPAQTQGSGDMKMTPTEAFIEVYPHGRNNPQSMALKPAVAEYPTTGYRGDDGVPQGNIGTLMLDVKGNTSKWIGDHYLPKETQNTKVEFVPPNHQISGWDAKVYDDGGFQSQGGLFTNLGDMLQKYLESGKAK
jgi:hypothetical protein